MKKKFIFALFLVTFFLFPMITTYAEPQNGWAKENGETYYYRDGKKVEGWQEIDGKTYFFGIGSKRMLTGWQSLGENKKFYLYEDGSVKQGWQEIGNEKYYVKDNYMLEGWQGIDGKTYFFGIGSARMLTGWQNLGENKKFYLYEDGSVKQGWQQIGNEKYYVKDNYMLEGWQQIDDKTYFFGIGSARMLTGWQNLGENKKFYLYEDGSVKQGWQQIGNEKYYVKDDYMLEGWQQIDGKTYFFGIESARMLTGWQNLNNKYFYLYDDGSIKQGWQEIDGNIYYVKDNYTLTGEQEIDNRLYMLSGKKGELVKGLQKTSTGEVYYINENGEYQTGWVDANNEKYYISPETGYAVEGWQEIDGKTYFFGVGSKRMLTGWQTLGTNKKFYLYEDGSVKQGWQQIGNEKYYVKDNYMLEGLQEIDGKIYLFGIGSARMLTGWQTLNNNIYYANMDGTLVTGNQSIEGRNYNFSSTGVLEGFVYRNGIMFYYNPDGTMAKGIQRMAGKYYQFNEYTGAFEKYVNQKIVIDISAHQGEIDWEAVKNSGMVDAVILRAGYGVSWTDDYFQRNVQELNRLGIPYSVYLFSYAENANEASMEADNLINIIKNTGANIASDIFSIYYDLEDWAISSTGENSYGISQQTYQEMFNSFSSKVESALGTDVKIYASKNYIETRFPESLRPEIGWVAQWGPELTYDGTYEGWQYTSDGSVPGINGRVDMSIFYY